jgi:hypothetical protein
MTLRLVLVSLVAALGLTIPGGPMIENWVATTQNWMNARFADWDTRNPQEADYVIINDSYDAVLATPRRATTSGETPRESQGIELASPGAKTPTTLFLTVASPAPKTVVRPVSFVRKSTIFTPIVAVGNDQPGIAFADELNRRSEGIGVVRPPVARRATVLPRFAPFAAAGSMYAAIAFESILGPRAGAAASPATVSPSSGRPQPAPPRFTPIVVAENPYSGIAHELNRRNEGLDIKSVATVHRAPTIAAPKVTSVAGFGSMETGENLYFAEPLEPVKPVVTVMVPRVTSPAAKIAPVASFDSGEDLFVEVAGELLGDSDGFATARPNPKAAAPVLASAPAPVVVRKFEPIEVGDDLYVGVAYELNRRNEGLNIPAIAVARAKKSPVGPPLPTRELNRAVKLTEEAVYAWVSVLTGPALVTVSK